MKLNEKDLKCLKLKEAQVMQSLKQLSWKSLLFVMRFPERNLHSNVWGGWNNSLILKMQ